jgi:hypothetical protein
MNGGTGWTLPERLAALAGMAAIAASIAGFVPGMYRDLPAVVAQSHGYDVGNLVSAGVLLVGLAATARGSMRGRLVAIGALGCLLYSFVTYAFMIVVNAASGLYIAVLCLGGWAFVTGLARVRDDDVDSLVDGHLARRTTALLLGAMALVFALNWLRQLATAALNGVPPELASIHWSTNPVWVLDLGFVLPLMAVAAWRLAVRLQGAARLAVPLLVFMALLGVTILSMAAWMAADGQVVEPVMPAIFVVETVVSGSLAARALAGRAAMRRSASASNAGASSA